MHLDYVFENVNSVYFDSLFLFDVKYRRETIRKYKQTTKALKIHLLGAQRLIELHCFTYVNFTNHCDKTRGIIYHDEINYKSLIKQAPAVVNCAKEQKNV